MELDESFTWSAQDYSPLDLIANFQDKFPLIVLVTEGFCGDNAAECLSKSEIWRLDSIESQTRVVCRDYNGRHYSIPSTYPAQFVIRDKKKTLGRTHKKSVCTKSHPLSTLLQHIELPAEVEMMNEGVIVSEDSQKRHLDKLIIEKSFSQRFMKASRVKQDGVKKHVVVIPAYIQARLVVAQESEEVNKMHHSAQSIRYDGVYLNHNILTYSEKVIREANNSAEEEEQYEKLAPIASYMPIDVYERLQQRDSQKDRSSLNIYEDLDEVTAKLVQQKTGELELCASSIERPPTIDVKSKQAQLIKEMNAAMKGKNTLRAAKKSTDFTSRHTTDAIKAFPTVENTYHNSSNSEKYTSTDNDRDGDYELLPPVPPRKESLAVTDNSKLSFRSKPLPETPKTPPEILPKPKKVNIDTLTCAQLCECLRKLGLNKYVPFIKENEVSGSSLKEYSKADFTYDIGMSPDDIKTITNFIKKGMICK